MFVPLKILQKLLKFTSIISAWWFLSGIDRSPREMNFTLKDLETKHMTQSMPPLSEIPLSFYFLAFSFLGTVMHFIPFSSESRGKCIVISAGVIS